MRGKKKAGKHTRDRASSSSPARTWALVTLAVPLLYVLTYPMLFYKFDDRPLRHVLRPKWWVMYSEPYWWLRDHGGPLKPALKRYDHLCRELIAP